MNELIKVNTDDKGDVIVSGRELHDFLESKEPYTQWFERMKEYGFIESVDFSVFQNFVNDDTAFGGVRKITEHAIKLDMAKEIAKKIGCDVSLISHYRQRLKKKGKIYG